VLFPCAHRWRFAALLAAASVAACSERTPKSAPPDAEVPSAEVPTTAPAEAAIEGDLVVKSAKDLEPLRGVREIRGALTIREADVTDLAALGALNRVGSLRVEGNARLVSLRGLGSLTEVAGDLVVDANPALATTDDLRALQRIGGAATFRGDGFDSVALASLAQVGSLVVERAAKLTQVFLPALKEVEGDATVQGAPLLSTLAGTFPALWRVGRTLRIGAPEELRNLALEAVELPALLSVDSLVTEGNPALVRLEAPALFHVEADLVVALEGPGLPVLALEKVQALGGRLALLLRNEVRDGGLGVTRVGGDVTLDGEAGSYAMRALRALVRIGGTLRMPRWKSSISLPALEEVGTLVVEEGQWSRGPVAFPRLTRAREIRLARNRADAITLPALTSVERMVVEDHALLTRLSLAALRGGAPQITVKGCPLLATVDLGALAEATALDLDNAGAPLDALDLSSLRAVRGPLTVVDGLRSVEALALLSRVDGDLRVWSRHVPQPALDGWVARLRAGGGLGGAVDVRFVESSR
jgi:hypothetical protein